MTSRKVLLFLAAGLLSSPPVFGMKSERKFSCYQKELQEFKEALSEGRLPEYYLLDDIKTYLIRCIEDKKEISLSVLSRALYRSHEWIEGLTEVLADYWDDFDEKQRSSLIKNIRCVRDECSIKKRQVLDYFIDDRIKDVILTSGEKSGRLRSFF